MLYRVGIFGAIWATGSLALRRDMSKDAWNAMSPACQSCYLSVRNDAAFSQPDCSNDGDPTQGYAVFENGKQTQFVSSPVSDFVCKCQAFAVKTQTMDEQPFTVFCK
jgi:hypothetical protein